MVKGILSAGRLLYRIWFYVLVAIPIIVFFPILVAFTLSERTYPQFFWLARNIWANLILYGMGCFPNIRYEDKLIRGKSYMLIANHTSMLDIMLMLKVSRNPFVFVGKKELVNIPIFGFFYKRVCIMVDRDNSNSRMGVYRRAQRRLDQGLSICIFPEGGVPPEDVILDQFKDGAFKLGISHKIPIVPMIFFDAKKRFPFSLNKGGPGRLKVTVYPFIQTETLTEKQAIPLRDSTREFMLKKLKQGA
ncbi:1-acyl-sn-glycerol-3-phosphate acyltransferase [Muriicola jejuensis]|uniref:1-acyl-sn-glycerol-3-phosphate acyltransferase n=1 Tax=Muriicola jejuensis TaxID=504488 RepID=A0A6P0U9G2_9FLAO|nr:lysophospholipid acyltransferase family protein [Muriicola jejuensis]NER09865.1 1-acyl-sn-glycerol-3-phosphate acyltransferase [Muriicola jejuensis]SMP05135.1 1-acyl-sn-glycerol-3-phosphate acyltransferase [Muriicola jejuensis]